METLLQYLVNPFGIAIVAIVFGCLAILLWATPKDRERLAFQASCGYIVGMLVGAAFALYPVVLPASTDPVYDLTIHNTAAGEHGLRVGVIWWTIGMALAVSYFVFVYRTFRGKVSLEGEGY